MPEPYNDAEIGPLIPGAKEFIEYLRKKGFDVVIYTARPESVRELIYTILVTKYDLFIKEVICGKPKAVYYIDDRAVRFEGDWKEFFEEFRELESRRSGNLYAKWIPKAKKRS